MTSYIHHLHSTGWDIKTGATLFNCKYFNHPWMQMHEIGYTSAALGLYAEFSHLSFCLKIGHLIFQQHRHPHVGYLHFLIFFLLSSSSSSTFSSSFSLASHLSAPDMKFLCYAKKLLWVFRRVLLINCPTGVRPSVFDVFHQYSILHYIFFCCHPTFHRSFIWSFVTWPSHHSAAGHAPAGSGFPAKWDI